MWENWMENNNHNQGPFFCLSSTYTQASENVTWYSMHTTYNSFSWTFIAPCSLFSYSLSIALLLIFIHPVLTGPKIRSLLQLWKLNHHVFSKYWLRRRMNCSSKKQFCFDCCRAIPNCIHIRYIFHIISCCLLFYSEAL